MTKSVQFKTHRPNWIADYDLSQISTKNHPVFEQNLIKFDQFLLQMLNKRSKMLKSIKNGGDQKF